MLLPDESPPVPVIFRRWKVGGRVIAVLPATPADSEGLACVSYESGWKRGGVNYQAVLRETTPAYAHEPDVGELIAELVDVGYDLKVVSRVLYPHIRERQRMADQAAIEAGLMPEPW